MPTEAETFVEDMAKLTDQVFAEYPDFDDHGRQVPWQWAASTGGQLLREALIEHGLKSRMFTDPGGWRCYITEAMKSPEFVKDWNRQQRDEQQGLESKPEGRAAPRC